VLRVQDDVFRLKSLKIIPDPILRVPTELSQLTRGPSELVQHFYRGSSHRRKSAACPTFDMVWLNRSPVPVGRRGGGGNFLVQMISPCPPRVEGGGGQHPLIRSYN
jgi:hypothetical protein